VILVVLLEHQKRVEGMVRRIEDLKVSLRLESGSEGGVEREAARYKVNDDRAGNYGL
jgi:hypothetical protein